MSATGCWSKLGQREEELRALNAELLPGRAPAGGYGETAAGRPRWHSATPGPRSSTCASGSRPTVAGTDRLRNTLATSEADNKTLAGQLAALQGELAALRADNNAMRRSAGVARDHRDDHDLRQRLSEIAANVVRLTQTIAAGDGVAPDGVADGTGNGTGRQPQPVAAAPVTGEPTTVSSGTTLAERLRALQHAGTRH